MKILALFKYVRLLEFCYTYGRLDHQELDCGVAVSLQKDNKKVQREYGPWLPVEGPKFSIAKFEDQGMRSQGDGVFSKTQDGERSVQLKGIQARDHGA